MSNIQNEIFGLTAVALLLVASVVLFWATSGQISIQDLALLFAGGCLASAWIAFEHWRTGELINV